MDTKFIVGDVIGFRFWRALPSEARLWPLFLFYYSFINTFPIFDDEDDMGYGWYDTRAKIISEIWKTNEEEAKCFAFPLPIEMEKFIIHGEIPSTTCSCGIYAYEWKGSLENTITKSMYKEIFDCDWLDTRFRKYFIVLGTVKLYGRIIKYTNGYRAEKAKIEKLWVPISAEIPNRKGYLQKLSDRYNCEVEEWDEDIRLA